MLLIGFVTGVSKLSLMIALKESSRNIFTFNDKIKSLINRAYKSSKFYLLSLFIVLAFIKNMVEYTKSVTNRVKPVTVKGIKAA